MNIKEQKIFLIINLSYFGDVLLTNVLCRNIKLEYPDSKIVFLVNKPFYEAARYQEGIDDVIVMDKRGQHKGLIGLLKFVFKCPYRGKIYAAFIMYGNDRGVLASFLLGARYRISGSNSTVKYLLTNIHQETDGLKRMSDINANFIKSLTGKRAKLLPVKYLTSPESCELTQNLKREFKNKTIIGLCCVSKQKSKDMPVETAIQLIKLANQDNKIVFLFGAGAACRDYADELKKMGCVNFIDLTNITSIYQLANVMTLCKSVISVDTGTMHLAYSIGRATVCVFYRTNMIEKWAPDDSLYKTTVIADDFSAENIYSKANEQ